MKSPSPKVKLIAAILYREEPIFQRALSQLEEAFSATDHISSPVPFTFTDYYQAEMGGNLFRKLVAFSELVNPASLVDAKWKSSGIEKALSVSGNRQVNLDMGYLDLFKLVLASFKERGNKLYLERGVWGDTTLFYQNGAFQSFDWSFPDFKSGVFDTDLLTIRSTLKQQLKSGEDNPGHAPHPSN